MKFLTWWVEIVEDNMKDDDESTAGDRKRRCGYFCFWDKNWCITKVLLHYIWRRTINCVVSSKQGSLLDLDWEFTWVPTNILSILKKKNFKWNCFRFWVTRSITNLDFIPLSSTDCCNLSWLLHFDDDRDLHRFWASLMTIEISTDSEL